jgi:hypothetical protein
VRKRNSLNYETVKALFDANLDAHGNGSYFKVSGGAEPEVFQVPTSVMHRLFRLGQAYGLRQLRHFESEVKVVVGTIEIAELASELRRLLGLVNDEALHEHLNKLLTGLESPPGLVAKTVAVSTGSYFEKRA